MGAPSPFFIIVSMPTDACTEMEYFIVLSPWRAGISGVSHSFLSLSPCTSSPCTPSLCTSLPSEWPTFIFFLTTNFRDKAEHQVFLFSMWLSRHPALQSTPAMLSVCWCHEWSILPGSQGRCYCTLSERISKSWTLRPKQLGWIAQKNHSFCTTSQTVCYELQLHQTGCLV